MIDSKWLARKSIWSGTLTFGLVSIPVSLFSAIRPREIGMHLYDGNGVPLRRRYYCPADGSYVEDHVMVKGYEVEDSVYVTLEDEELEALQPEKSGDIDLRRFVPRKSISPLYFNRPYFLFPTGKSVKAYRLLVLVLQKKETAGIATFVMRDREYLVAILADQGVLWAETLHFVEELRKPALIGLPEMQSDARQVRAMADAINALTVENPPVEDLRDYYRERLERLVAEKEKKRKDVVKIKKREEAEPGGAEVDLMKILKERLMEEEAAA